MSMKEKGGYVSGTRSVHELHAPVSVLPVGYVIQNIYAERRRQVALFGEDQHHPDGTASTDEARWQRDFDQKITHTNDKADCLTWRDILQEEVSEAFAETDWLKLRAELVQVAAVCVAWIEDGDRRNDL